MSDFNIANEYDLNEMEKYDDEIIHEFIKTSKLP